MKVVIVVHKESEEMNKRQKSIRATKIFKKNGQRVPWTLSINKMKPKALKTDEHARHMSACTKGKIRMFIVNANIEEKQEIVRKTKQQRKRKGTKRKGTENKNDKAATHLATVLLNTIRNGGT